MTDLEGLLRETARRLHLIGFLGRGLRLSLIVGALAFVPCLALAMAGAGFLPLIPWIASIGILWAVLRYRTRVLVPNTAEAARWLDRQWRSGDLLAAARLCFNEQRSNPYAAEIMRRADELRASSATPRFPWRKLSGLGAGCAAMLCAGVFVVAVADANPLAPVLPFGGLAAQVEPDISSGDPAGQDAAELAARQAQVEAEAQALAADLFPGDEGMAAEAARAIAQGDADALNELLRRADLESLKVLAQTGDAAMREAIRQERERRDRAAGSAGLQRILAQNRALRDANSDSGQQESERGGDSRAAEDSGSASSSERRTANQDGNGREGASERDNRGQAGETGRNGSGDGSDEGQEPQGESEGRTASGNSQGGQNGSGDMGDGATQSSGNATDREAVLIGDRKTLDPAEGSDDSVTIGDPENDVGAAIVLSQAEVRAPDRGDLGAARRASEAAVARTSVPLSYEAFIEHYFTALEAETE